MFGHEGVGRGPGSADLPANAYLNPPHWSLHAAVLQPGQTRAVCFPVSGGRPRIPTAAWGYQDLYCAKGLLPTPHQRAKNLSTNTFIERSWKLGRPLKKKKV